MFRVRSHADERYLDQDNNYFLFPVFSATYYPIICRRYVAVTSENERCHRADCGWEAHGDACPSDSKRTTVETKSLGEMAARKNFTSLRLNLLPHYPIAGFLGCVQINWFLTCNIKYSSQLYSNKKLSSEVSVIRIATILLTFPMVTGTLRERNQTSAGNEDSWVEDSFTIGLTLEHTALTNS